MPAIYGSVDPILALMLLLGSTLLSGEAASVSMDCSSIASVHTREVVGPVVGPEAVVTFLRIYSEDDHAKNAHLCQAEYQLIIVPFVGQAAEIIRLFSSDGDWGRRLTAHIDGFSRDFAVLSHKPSQILVNSGFRYWSQLTRICTQY